MQDKSYLDKKYFIDIVRYNWPYCNRNNIIYEIVKNFCFDWTTTKKCYVYFVECSGCKKISMHLSFEKIGDYLFTEASGSRVKFIFDMNIDIDSKLIRSQPTSFFVIDKRIPRVIRDLITEAEGCIKMNYLTGASACIRKAIYEFIKKEKSEGEEYDEQIKSLKTKFPNVNTKYFDTLKGIQEISSNKLHEYSWDKLNSNHIKLFIFTLKTILHDIYIIPKEKERAFKEIQKIQADIKKDKKVKKEKNKN